MTQKTAVAILIGPATGISVVKMVAAESLIMGAVDVDRDDIHREIASIR